MPNTPVNKTYPAPSTDGYQDQENSVCCASRMTARMAIEHRIKALDQEAMGLQKLLNAMPGELPSQADAALWSLVMRG